MGGKYSLAKRSSRKTATFYDSSAETESRLRSEPRRRMEEPTPDGQLVASPRATLAERKDISGEIAGPPSTRMEDLCDHLPLHAKEPATSRRKANQIKRRLRNSMSE